MLNKYILLALLLSSFACSNKQKEQVLLPYYNEATFTPNWFENDESVPKDFHTISDFSLINQEGDSIHKKDLNGKIYVVDFFFTVCPGICPTMTKNMIDVQQAFIDDDHVEILSLSVTPQADSVAQLKKYADEKGVISSKWHLLTGNKELIYKLGRKYFFIEEDLGLEKKEDDFIHTENFVLVDANQHIRGIYNGLNKTSVKQLIQDIHSLLQ